MKPIFPFFRNFSVFPLFSTLHAFPSNFVKVGSINYVELIFELI